MTQDRLQGASPSGAGFSAQPEPLTGLGPSGGYHSRMQWQPIATAPKDGSAIIAWLKNRVIISGNVEDEWIAQAVEWIGGEWVSQGNVYGAVYASWKDDDLSYWMPMPSAPVDERPTGPRPSGLGAEPASAVDGANSEVEAPDPEISDLEVTHSICLDKLKRENAELREALEKTQEALGKAQRSQVNALHKFALMTRPQDIRLAAGEMPAQEMRTARAIANWYLTTARSLLSQLSEGE